MITEVRVPGIPLPRFVMQKFARLISELEHTRDATSSSRAIVHYLQQVSPAEAAWALWLLAGHRPERCVSTVRLMQWLIGAFPFPDWLVKESRAHVGGSVETITLLAGPGPVTEIPLNVLMEERMRPLAGMDADSQRRMVVSTWAALEQRQRLIFNKLLTGGFRTPTRAATVAFALAEFCRCPIELAADWLAESRQPTRDWFESLCSGIDAQRSEFRDDPYREPVPVTVIPQCGRPDEWLVEWKATGLRIRLIRDAGKTMLWTHERQPIPEMFPEVLQAAQQLPDGTVLEGDLVVQRHGQPVPPGAWRLKRSGRVSGAERPWFDTASVTIWDLLEIGGRDARAMPLHERRRLLQSLLSRNEHEVARETRSATAELQDNSAPRVRQGLLAFESESDEKISGPGLDKVIRPALQLSELCEVRSWQDCEGILSGGDRSAMQGLMLRRLDSCHTASADESTVDNWWLLKPASFTSDLVLLYAHRRSGSQPPAFLHYTLAARSDSGYVPVVKLNSSGLSSGERTEIDTFIRDQTEARFGPVHHVRPELVFKVSFAGVRRSTRHKAGVTLSEPVLLCRNRSIGIEQVTTVNELRAASGPVE